MIHKYFFFTENVHIFGHEGDWPLFLFFVRPLPDFGNRVILVSFRTFELGL